MFLIALQRYAIFATYAIHIYMDFQKHYDKQTYINAILSDKKP